MKKFLIEILMLFLCIVVFCAIGFVLVMWFLIPLAYISSWEEILLYYVLSICIVIGILAYFDMDRND